MASILRPFAAVARALRAFFRADVRLRRGERGLEVVLHEPGRAPTRLGRAMPSAEEVLAAREQQELQRIRASLAQLLDGLPGSRATLRHLAFVEHALGRSGLRGLGKVPYDVLRRALDQFEAVVLNWSDEGLATLRSKMAVMLIERAPEARVTTSGPAGRAPDADADIEATALAHPVTLEGDDAAEAQAALLAAYGNVMLPGLELGTPAAEPAAAPSAVDLQGERQSPSAKAIARADRRAEDRPTAARAPELHA